jgi:RNA polymerase sigma factor (TIGR02999 family)
MGDVTELLERWNSGDSHALGELFGVVHAELRRLAGSLLKSERPNHTLQPSDLIHEAYLRLEGIDSIPFSSRRHFYGAAAKAMRRILVDYARRRAADKRGGPDRLRVALDEASQSPVDLRLDFIRLDEALTEFAALAPDKAQVVELRYFAGLSIQETADVLDIAPATVKRHWTFARAWLQRAMGVAPS